MSTTEQIYKTKLPRRFSDLVCLLPPQAIMDDVQHKNTVDMIDRLMAGGTLSKGQSIYLETLIQLVQVYESTNFHIDTSGINGLDSLKHLLHENGMNASDLARLLGVHVSMGSKILKGERSLTVDHLKTLAKRFRVRPDLFIV